jgi:tetratricopeptide (TPR) repeat protein
MGVVYRATDTAMGREVAVKVLQEKYAPHSGTARRFADEARITAQLQHPNVPAVHDLGVLPDGRSFLAMKLIKGETLDDLLKQRADPADDRGRFVAAFEHVCQAVAYAHAHDVIHRDLKTANVMVGAFGEVQVMDWGLARVLGARPGGQADPDETTAPTEVRTQRDKDDLFTQAGCVLGTPAFMPPEQAAGAVAVIDRRSDVFGLGAVLAVVLTGRPPFEADTSESTRVKAAQGDVGACFARLDACRADPDLVALCRRCLSPRPEDRPADAGSVALAVATLRAAADERARQAEMDRVRAEGEAREALARAVAQRLRRRMLLIAGGIIAVVLLVGLGASLWQTRRAMRAEAAAITSAEQARLNAEEAERNGRQAGAERDAKALALAAEQKARQRAFAALRTITAEVVERKFAQGAALTGDDRAFLQGVIAQFDAFAAIKGDDADSRAVRAEGRLRVGWMRYRLGELKEAEKDYDEALSIRKQLVADFPSRPEFRNELAGSHSNRGIVLRATGRLKEAETDWSEALSIRKQLVADFPTRPEFRQELAGGYNNRAVLRRDRGRFQEAVEDCSQAVSIRMQLAAEFPDRPDFRRALAGSLMNRGIVRRDMGQLNEAEQDYGKALSIQRQLAAEFPARPDFCQELANGHNSRGNLLRATGRLEEAEKDADQALSIYKQLAAKFPARPDFRQMLAGSHVNRSTLLRATGRLPEAEKDCGQALTIYTQLVADFPNQPDLRSELAGTCGNLATIHEQLGNLAAAKRLLLEGLPHHMAALKANPRQPAYRQSYRYHLAVLTATHAGLLEQEEAVRTAEACRGLGWDAPADAYNAACHLSRCIPVVAKHDKLDDERRKEAAHFYSDVAMKFLRDAVSKGHKDVALMKKDADLDPLRQRDDYQQIVAELEDKGKAGADKK